MASPSGLPTTMRAAQWHSVSGGMEKHLAPTGDAKLPKGVVDSVPLPPDHTLVRVAYASVNHLDYKMAEMVPFVVGKPATPGLDFSGVVVASTVGGLQPGRRVLGRTEPPSGGTLAEYVLVKGADHVAALPDGVSLRDAACVGICGVSALQALAPFAAREGSPESKRVLVIGGSGGVGTFAIQVAKALGYGHVTAVCSGAGAGLCRNLGADEVLDYKSGEGGDLATRLGRSGLQYDHILDAVFADSNLYFQCHHYLSAGGTYVCVGLPLQFSTFRSLAAIHLLPAFIGGGRRKFRYHAVTANAEDLARVARWIGEGRVRPVIEEEFALDDAASAYARLKAGRTRGKLVVRVGGEELVPGQ